MSLLNRIQDYFRKEVAPSIASRGMLYYRQGDYDGARDRFDRAARFRPPLKQEPLFQAYWALSRYRTGETLEALEHFGGLLNKLHAHQLAGGELASHAIAEIEEILGEHAT